nr:hypothetical protein [Tanacetum cinerariifolium]
MSDSEDSTVTYTTVSSPYEGQSRDVSLGVDGPPVMPKDPYAYVVAAFQALPLSDYVPGPEESEQAPPSPFTYLMYRSRCTQNDADEEDEEQDEDDDDDEEKHPASADSILPPPTLHRPEVTLPPRKRLNIVHGPGYEAGESSVAAVARPMKVCRADYGFVDYVVAKIRRRRAEDIGYGIRDIWIDSRDVAEEEALTTLEGVNTRAREQAHAGALEGASSST